ncbi:4Fe-4S binding protein [Myxosarcina sp. GI1]|uniref:4Fe-4S binding protein n=1 Tax=Myxosarcina sp. GI1 TaxID=1541065 RepID=UPI00055BF1B9|nr:4Fe-4S binding protein [Myxosarcina sp. GI1]
MTYAISDQCIACEKCLPHCPTEAISKNSSGKFSIDPNLCNDCVGYYGVAQCMAGCPTSNGCTPTISSLIKSFQTDRTTTNYWDNWFATYDRAIARLKAKQETKYWQQWFDTYSQKLDLLLHN